MSGKWSEPELPRGMFDGGHFRRIRRCLTELGTVDLRRRSVHVKVDLADDTTPKTGYNDALRRDLSGNFFANHSSMRGFK